MSRRGWALALVLALGACGARTAQVPERDGAPPDAPRAADLARPDLARPDLPPSTGWAVSAGGPGSDWAWGLAADAQGYLYVTGHFQGTAQFGPHTLYSKSNTQDMFLTRLSPQGKFLWAVRAGGGGEDRGCSVTTVPGGGVIVSGLFSKEADFGALTLKSAGATDAFVARYDADGKVQWVSQVSSPGSAWAWRVSSDGSGGAVLTGKHSGQATLGGLSLPGHGADDFFTAHVDAQGSFSWASGAGWYGNQGGWGVAAVGQGGAIATGRFEWTVNFGPVTLAAAGDDDIFIVKYGPGGKVQWARSAGGNSQDWGWDVAADGTGGALLAGHFNGLAQFDQSTVDAKGGADVFVARYSAAGKLLWVQSAGGPKLDRAYGVARDGSGALVTGYFADQALFGGHQLTAQGETDLFVARLDSAGSWDWALAAGGAGHERPAGLALGPGHTLYVAGDFTKTTRLGTQALTAKGQEDVFVWKLPLP